MCRPIERSTQGTLSRSIALRMVMILRITATRTTLAFLSGGREAIVEGSELGIATVADQSRHVEHAPHRSTAAPDAAHPLEPAAVKVVGRNSDQRRNLLAVHLSEFWQQGEERDGQHRAYARHGDEQRIPSSKHGIACDDLGETLVEQRDVRGQPSNAPTI